MPLSLGIRCRGFAAAFPAFGPWEQGEGHQIHLLPFPDLPFSLLFTGSAGTRLFSFSLLFSLCASPFSLKQRETTNQRCDFRVTAVLLSPLPGSRGGEAAFVLLLCPFQVQGGEVFQSGLSIKYKKKRGEKNPLKYSLSQEIRGRINLPL